MSFRLLCCQIQSFPVFRHMMCGKKRICTVKKTMGVVRTTYLIDEEGVIVKAFGKVKAADNPAQMLGEL